MKTDNLLSQLLISAGALSLVLAIVGTVAVR